MTSNFGGRLKMLRQQRKMSQRYLEKKAGLSNSCVSRYESNVIKPSAESLIKLSDALNLSMETLLGVDSNYNSENSSDSGNTFKNIKKKFFENLSINTGGVPYEKIEKAYYASTNKSVFNADNFYNTISKDISADFKGVELKRNMSFDSTVERLLMFYESNVSFLKSIKDSYRYLRSAKIRKLMEEANEIIKNVDGIYKYNAVDKILIKYTELRFMSNMDAYQDCVIKAEYECINFRDSNIYFGTETFVNPLPCYTFLEETLDLAKDNKNQILLSERFNKIKNGISEIFKVNNIQTNCLKSEIEKEERK